MKLQKGFELREHYRGLLLEGLAQETELGGQRASFEVVS